MNEFTRVMSGDIFKAHHIIIQSFILILKLKRGQNILEKIDFRSKRALFLLMNLIRERLNIREFIFHELRDSLQILSII